MTLDELLDFVARFPLRIPQCRRYMERYIRRQVIALDGCEIYGISVAQDEIGCVKMRIFARR